MTTSEALRWFVRCTADMVDWFTSLQWHRIMHCVCVCVCVLNVCLSCPAFALRNSMLVEYLFKPEDKRLATPEQQSGKQHNAQCTIHCFGATPLQTCSAHNACLCLSFFLFVCLFVCLCVLFDCSGHQVCQLQACRRGKQSPTKLHARPTHHPALKTLLHQHPNRHIVTARQLSWCLLLLFFFNFFFSTNRPLLRTSLRPLGAAAL